MQRSYFLPDLIEIESDEGESETEMFSGAWK